MNYAKRHTYYVNKTKAWLCSAGFHAETIESNYQIVVAGRPVFVKKDLWGADVVARRLDVGTCFIQVKTSLGQIRKGVVQLSSDKNWPPGSRRFVVAWQSRVATPHVCEVTTGNEGAGDARPVSSLTPNEE